MFYHRKPITDKKSYEIQMGDVQSFSKNKHKKKNIYIKLLCKIYFELHSNG